MPTSLNLPPNMTLEMDALIAAGGEFNTRSELMRAAWREFLQRLPKAKRLSLATELFRRGKATISRAAEIADIPFYEMRRILIAEGLAVAAHDVEDFPEDVKRLAARLRKSRR